jgi:hypothetical protein
VPYSWNREIAENPKCFARPGRPERGGGLRSVWTCPAIYLAAAAFFKPWRVELRRQADLARDRDHLRRVPPLRGVRGAARGLDKPERHGIDIARDGGLHVFFIGMTRDFFRRHPGVRSAREWQRLARFALDC